MAGILQQRAASEAVFESGTLGANQMSARSLSILFDECKGAKSMEDVERLAHEFGVDFEVLKELARHFNSPSVEMVKEGNAANGEQDTMLVSPLLRLARLHWGDTDITVACAGQVARASADRQQQRECKDTRLFILIESLALSRLSYTMHSVATRVRALLPPTTNERGTMSVHFGTTSRSGASSSSGTTAAGGLAAAPTHYTNGTTSSGVSSAAPAPAMSGAGPPGSSPAVSASAPGLQQAGAAASTSSLSLHTREILAGFRDAVHEHLVRLEEILCHLSAAQLLAQPDR